MRRQLSRVIAICWAAVFVGAAGCGSERMPVVYVDLNDASVQEKIEQVRAGGGGSGTDSVQPAAQGTGWGTLKGVFKYDGQPPQLPPLLTGGKDARVGGQVVCGDSVVNEALVVDPANQGIANVLIFARKVSRVRDEAADAAQPVFDQKECHFLSHVMGVQTGAEIIIKNSDPVGHNTSIAPTGDEGVNRLLAPGGETTYTFNRAQTNPVPVTCDVHKWMRAFILPRSDPYFAVTASDGSFEITDLPAGEDIEFQIWHEMAGGSGGGLEAKPEWSRGRITLRVPENGVEDLGTVLVPAAAFQ